MRLNPFCCLLVGFQAVRFLPLLFGVIENLLVDISISIFLTKEQRPLQLTLDFEQRIQYLGIGTVRQGVLHTVFLSPAISVE